MRPTLWMDPPTVDEFIEVVVKTVLLIHTPFSVLVWIECNSQEEQEVNLETQRVHILMINNQVIGLSFVLLTVNPPSGAPCPDGLKHSVL